jgi:hypothetical protein
MLLKIIEKNAGQIQCFDDYNKGVDQRTCCSLASDRERFFLQNKVFWSCDEHLIKTLITFLKQKAFFMSDLAQNSQLFFLNVKMLSLF